MDRYIDYGKPDNIIPSAVTHLKNKVINSSAYVD